jgi:hypothetical protein
MSEPTNLRAFLELLAKEEPRLTVGQQALPRPAVVLIVQYPSGALTVPLEPSVARKVAATLVEYAGDLERVVRARN